jgi:riboflavin kinase / FMN adenylyltransferase
VNRVTVARALGEVEPVPSVVTIGNFDGVHRGHRTLLRRAVDAAHAADAADAARAVAVTFDPHPAAIVRPGSEPPALQTLASRIDSLAATGVDLVLVLPFTAELAALTPADFVHHVLVDRLSAVRVIVGTNFRFGHRAAGDVVTLVEEGERYGFGTEAVTLLDLDGEPISSSSIRAHLATGDVDWATRALGRPHRVRGEVVPGDGRGRTIGVPTANVAVPPGLQLPGDGVYAGHATHAGTVYPAVTNVGMRPTFDGTARTVEAHLLDAEVELYGSELEVTFEHHLRGEQRFDDVAALVAQIRRDIRAAGDLLDPASGQR